MTARLRYRSPVGPLFVEATDEGVVGLSFGDGGPGRAGVSALARAHLESARAALDAYFDGKPPVLPRLVLHGSPFQERVWRALLEIPWAEVRTYGEVAAALGAPGAARAVGAANHHNPIAILVPCHRVVQTGGRLGGYGGGVGVKRWLLAHEAAFAPALRA